MRRAFALPYAKIFLYMKAGFCVQLRKISPICIGESLRALTQNLSEVEVEVNTILLQLDYLIMANYNNHNRKPAL